MLAEETLGQQQLELAKTNNMGQYIIQWNCTWVPLMWGGTEDPETAFAFTLFLVKSCLPQCQRLRQNYLWSILSKLQKHSIVLKTENSEIRLLRIKSWRLLMQGECSHVTSLCLSFCSCISVKKRSSKQRHVKYLA